MNGPEHGDALPAPSVCRARRVFEALRSPVWRPTSHRCRRRSSSRQACPCRPCPRTPRCPRSARPSPRRAALRRSTARPGRCRVIVGAPGGVVVEHVRDVGGRAGRDVPGGIRGGGAEGGRRAAENGRGGQARVGEARGRRNRRRARRSWPACRGSRSTRSQRCPGRSGSGRCPATTARSRSASGRRGRPSRACRRRARAGAHVTGGVGSAGADLRRLVGGHRDAEVDPPAARHRARVRRRPAQPAAANSSSVAPSSPVVVTCGLVSVAEGDGGEVLTTAGAAGGGRVLDVRERRRAGGEVARRVGCSSRGSRSRLSAGTVVGIAKSPPAAACPLPAGVPVHAASV